MSTKRSHQDRVEAYRWWAEVSGADRANRLPTVVLVLIEDRDEGGCFLEGYDRRGAETTSTWHGGMPAAKAWAATEHAPADVGVWHPIPNDVLEPAAYAMRQIR
jgi:hypothetical protein